MLFNSLTFLLLHAVSLLLFWNISSQRLRLVLLLFSSFVFYGWFYWPGLLLLVGIIGVNYFFSWAVNEYRQKWIFIVAICLNFLNLGWFKYSGFLFENIELVFAYLNFEVIIPKPNYWLPLGISFYTFQFLGYLIDLYNEKVKHEKSILTFAVFKCYYAQLIAGPIVRANELLPQLNTKTSFDLKRFQKGFFLLLGGLFVKVCVADILSQFVQFGFENAATMETLKAWLALYGFAFQILSDFWGYSTMAVGIGLMYGINLPNNFNFPYIATSFQDFWRRWHITLSEWFRDYLYIPLGGNRGRMGIYFNLIVTMTLAGIWHGAGWNFLFWGLGHGILLAIERRWSLHKIGGKQKWVKVIHQLIVFHFVCLLWVFFRAASFDEAVSFFNSLLLPPYNFSASHMELLIIVISLFLIFNRKLGRLFEGDNFTNLSVRKQLGITLTLFLLIIAYADATLDFIYFVF
jgi:alginate O-acetyltransferase complex protein AlgI